MNMNINSLLFLPQTYAKRARAETLHNRCNVLKFTFPDSVITSGIIKIFTVYSDGAIFVMPVFYGVMHFTVFSSVFMPDDCNL